MMPFPLYHRTEGGGFPSTGHVTMVRSPGETRYVLFLSVTCGETKRKEQAGYYCQKTVNTCTMGEGKLLPIHSLK